MEKRLLLAVVLMTAAILITNLLFPPAEAPPPPVDPSGSTVATESPAPATAIPDGTTAAPLPLGAPAPADAVAGDSVIVESELYHYVFSTRGAALLEASLPQFSSYQGEDEVVQLVPPGDTGFLSNRLVVGGDTVELGTLPFTVTRQRLEVSEESGPQSLTFAYTDPSGFGINLSYTFEPARYLVAVGGTVSGLGGRQAQLLTQLGPRMEIHEHPDHNSEAEFAVVTRTPSGVDRLAFRRVEGRQLVDPGLTWAGIKDKYFLAVVIAGEETPLAGAVVQDVPDLVRQVNGDEREVPQALVTTILPIGPDGGFEYDAYLGPQEFDRLSAIGYELEDVTPYGYRWLQPIIRPLAAAVLWVLNTLHDTLGVAYGWVLAIFGVMMRIVLWPLNAKAMRAQMKNMAVQPLLQEIRDKYKNDPQKQQEAMLGLYKEHGFNPFAGCLPMLVPFPVLITLFFVFQNTIAFRGAEFLWLPDLSLRDPFYILPLILVVSMFALQWVSAHLSGMEQNPQMKMMMYFMPIMMGVIFFMLPAGLNLYYAVTNVASVPQQVLIAKERRRAQEALKPPPKKAKARR
jgi:YidC/Oxa1 family membrane protein insertase